MRFKKIRANMHEPLNEATEMLRHPQTKLRTRWRQRAESDPAQWIWTQSHPEVVHFLYKEVWLVWDARARKDLVQRAAELCLNCSLRLKRER
jgi:hypothetical protein